MKRIVAAVFGLAFAVLVAHTADAAAKYDGPSLPPDAPLCLTAQSVRGLDAIRDVRAVCNPGDKITFMLKPNEAVTINCDDSRCTSDDTIDILCDPQHPIIVVMNGVACTYKYHTLKWITAIWPERTDTPLHH